MEFPVKSVQHQKHLDIWLPEEGIAIELKYKTRELEVKDKGECFHLTNQAAQDLGRYDFLHDVERLELMRCSMPEFKAGYAVLLTNNPLYWKDPSRDTVDSDFRVHDGREVKGELAWAASASPGTRKGRFEPIKLQGSYRLRWQDYSEFAKKWGKFRFLVVSVNR